MFSLDRYVKSRDVEGICVSIFVALAVAKHVQAPADPLSDNTRDNDQRDCRKCQLQFMMGPRKRGRGKFYLIHYLITQADGPIGLVPILQM